MLVSVLKKKKKDGKEVANPSMQVVNFLLGAIKTSDLVLTVSPGTLNQNLGPCPYRIPRYLNRAIEPQNLGPCPYRIPRYLNRALIEPS
jgi:hypothetical protein